ncbi:unnamed protein product [Cuscuta epithymum]|uniref:Uncharacterized protein n=1 Tax=Cuscuta epithymum TaxID=186058 RepID=A0AAV0FQC0_9ASTE|nr:unnamed protein product [Cuscuta epithymum]CAH9141750.1 unnamed protein product [Cuscuta epithymum]
MILILHFKTSPIFSIRSFLFRIVPLRVPSVTATLLHLSFASASSHTFFLQIGVPQDCWFPQQHQISKKGIYLSAEIYQESSRLYLNLSWRDAIDPQRQWSRTQKLAAHSIALESRRLSLCQC